jgi:ABC-2 type transport system ATP-binding protein
MKTGIGGCLQVVDVGYSYGPRAALDGVVFDVAEGRFCALLGPNGAGKSTLFALMTRLLLPQSGHIVVAGEDLSTTPRRALAQIGVVFQQATLDLDLTVHRNLRYFAALHGLSGAPMERAIDRSLDLLDMRERAGERARDLNGGHRRRAEIARALVHGPSVLLLDEPTVGLDAASRAGIVDHVHMLCEVEALCALWATHLVDEVRPGDDLVVLHKGRVLARGIAADIAAGKPLDAAFLSMTAA